MFNCEICKYETKNKSNYSKHLESLKHNRNENNISLKTVHTCINCDYKTDNKSNYNKHIKSLKHINNTKDVVDVVVDVIDVVVDVVVVDVVEVVEVKIEYECKDCEYKTLFKSNYTKHNKSKKHLITIGEKEKTKKVFSCDICEYTSCDGSNMRKHMKKHPEHSQLKDFNFKYGILDAKRKKLIRELKLFIHRDCEIKNKELKNVNDEIKNLTKNTIINKNDKIKLIVKENKIIENSKIIKNTKNDVVIKQNNYVFYKTDELFTQQIKDDYEYVMDYDKTYYYRYLQIITNTMDSLGDRFEDIDMDQITKYNLGSSDFNDAIKCGFEYIENNKKYNS